MNLYFKPVKRAQRYAVAQHLKEGIIWQLHNLLSDPPGTGFQLVFLPNNLLTYYKDEFKAPAFQKVVQSLTEGGFLIIGTHEKIPPGARGLLPLSHYPYIFRNCSLRRLPPVCCSENSVDEK